MVRPDNSSFIDVVGDDLFVEGQRECLANFDIIKWFHQIVHRKVDVTE